jgi:MFS family permease
MYSIKEKQDMLSGWNGEVKISRLTFRGQLVLNLLWFALNAQSSALLPIVIPAQIVLFITSNQVGSIQQVLFLSWLMIGASVISLFIPPLIGTLSDRTPGGFGRRRPYIVIGGLLVMISTPLLVNAGSLVIFVAGLALLLLGKNILAPAYQSLMPDRVPGEQRGEAAGYVGGMTILGNVVGLGLAAFLLGRVNQHSFSISMIRANAGIYYAVTAVLVLVGILVTVCGVRENRWLKHKQDARKAPGLFELALKLMHWWIAPWRHFNFTMVFLARASLMLGLSLFMAYIEYFFANVQHIANFIQVTGIVAILALGGAVVSGLVFGVLSDRVKRRAPVVSAATVCMALASLTFVIFPNNLLTLLWPLGIVFGLGYGAYSSVGWALSIDVLPSLEKAGKDLGVWNASTTLPAILAPLLGSVIINAVAGTGHILLGYQLVFGAAALFFMLAAIGMLFVKK